MVGRIQQYFTRIWQTGYSSTLDFWKYSVYFSYTLVQLRVLIIFFLPGFSLDSALWNTGGATGSPMIDAEAVRCQVETGTSDKAAGYI